jgi:hypothetical protein
MRVYVCARSITLISLGVNANVRRNFGVLWVCAHGNIVVDLCVCVRVWQEEGR